MRCIIIDRVIDHYNGNEIAYPPKEKPILKYDFHFRKLGETTWRYINSADKVDIFNEQSESVLEHMGQFRIVASETGKIVRGHLQ